MSITKITTPELLDFPNDSTSSANTSGTVIPTGNTAAQPSTNLNAGEFRLNTTTGYVEYYDGSTWLQIADEYISGQPTVCICNYPTTATALYQFESNGNDTCASNDQTTVGTLTYSAGKFDNGVSGFSGSNYFATSGLIGTVIGTTAAKSFTMSAWIKTTDNGAEQHIAGNTVWSSGSGTTLYVNSDKLYLAVSAGGSNGGNGAAGAPYAYTSQVVADNTWHHVAVTYSSDGQTSGSARGLLGLFVDGVNVTSSATFTQSGSSWTNGEANPWTTYTDDYFRTGRGDGTGNPFAGEIDQLRIYQSVLTDAQITELYNEVVCN